MFGLVLKGIELCIMEMIEACRLQQYGKCIRAKEEVEYMCLYLKQRKESRNMGKHVMHKAYVQPTSYNVLAHVVLLLLGRTTMGISPFQMELLAEIWSKDQYGWLIFSDVLHIIIIRLYCVIEWNVCRKYLLANVLCIRLKL